MTGNYACNKVHITIKICTWVTKNYFVEKHTIFSGTKCKETKTAQDKYFYQQEKEPVAGYTGALTIGS
jgi:hypothetical protein